MVSTVAFSLFTIVKHNALATTINIECMKYTPLIGERSSARKSISYGEKTECLRAESHRALSRLRIGRVVAQLASDKSCCDCSQPDMACISKLMGNADGIVVMAGVNCSFYDVRRYPLQP
jgi:hypothetical protein